MAVEDRSGTDDVPAASSSGARRAAIVRRLASVEVLLDTRKHLHALGRLDMACAARVLAGKLLAAAERTIASYAYGPSEERSIP